MARRTAAEDSPDFYDQSDGAEAKAKAFCEACPVKTECLEYAITEVDAPYYAKIVYTLGVWGGKTGRERVTIRRSRNGRKD